MSMFLIDFVFNDLASITPELTQSHRDYLQTEYSKNTLMFGGRKEPRTGGIVLSKHDNREDLETFLKQDPFITSGVASYSIVEFLPMMASNEFKLIL